jgi:CDP-paratose 2-epimerase
VTNPREDFEVNALGTFNVLEAVRLSSAKPIVVYSSTNKVYGKMDDIEVTEDDGRYTYKKLVDGVTELYPLDFYSPYGCSKGAGDQYVIDYARIYGLKTIVFRQSCIYGPHQFGIEDQGWVAWFSIRALQNLPVTIYGDGKQIRDVLYMGELIEAYNAAIEEIDATAGQAYNIGGGPMNTLSLLELIDLLELHLGYRLEYSFDDWRPGDQLVFVSDIRKAKTDFGWQPRTRPAEGVAKLISWLERNEHLFVKL